LRRTTGETSTCCCRCTTPRWSGIRDGVLGTRGVRHFVRDLDEAFAELHIEVVEVRDLGDQVLAIGHLHARGTASGAETETPIAYLLDFKHGKATRILTYLDPTEALEAAGLGE
jgi:ketosteroid isomerase-like protein